MTPRPPVAINTLGFHEKNHIGPKIRL